MSLSVNDNGMRSPGAFRVTLVGFGALESGGLERALQRSPFAVEFRRVPQASSSPFSERVVHAIVFTARAFAHATAADATALWSAMDLGTCRAYRMLPAGSSLDGPSPLDDFIQRTTSHDDVAIADQIVGFFGEVDRLNRRSVRLGLRDKDLPGRL